LAGEIGLFGRDIVKVEDNNDLTKLAWYDVGFKFGWEEKIEEFKLKKSLL
jgi:hypothetical protein